MGAMSKRVLDVGNCDADHAQIRAVIESEFPAEVVRCHGMQDALKQLRASPFHLVLVNRILDRDQSRGLEVIAQIKAEQGLAATPCMLLSNYTEHQQAAISAGAEPGFGKAELRAAATRERLARFLG
jgi:CheY-like chemotaxis protein